MNLKFVNEKGETVLTETAQGLKAEDPKIVEKLNQQGTEIKQDKKGE